MQAIDLVQRATVSAWPGTTLSVLKFPILNPSGKKLFLRTERLKNEGFCRREEAKYRDYLFRETGNIELASLEGSGAMSGSRLRRSTDQPRSALSNSNRSKILPFCPRRTRWQNVYRKRGGRGDLGSFLGKDGRVHAAAASLRPVQSGIRAESLVLRHTGHRSQGSNTGLANHRRIAGSGPAADHLPENVRLQARPDRVRGRDGKGGLSRRRLFYQVRIDRVPRTDLAFSFAFLFRETDAPCLPATSCL